MKKLLALTALTVSLAAIAPASATVYSLNQTVGGGFASGTITTDNTLGALTAANITAFNITINDGSSSFVLTQANAGKQSAGTAFTATASGLFFNFGAAAGAYLLFQNPSPGSSINYFCLQTSGCYSPAVAGEGLRVQGALLNNTLSGNYQFASAATAGVPEPATWGLMLLGFGAVGYSLRRRKARIAYA